MAFLLLFSPSLLPPPSSFLLPPPYHYIGASGNVATEDVVYMLHGMGISTGIDLAKLAEVGKYITNTIGRENQSKAGRALVSGGKKKKAAP